MIAYGKVETCRSELLRKHSLVIQILQDLFDCNFACICDVWDNLHCMIYIC